MNTLMTRMAAASKADVKGKEVTVDSDIEFDTGAFNEYNADVAIYETAVKQLGDLEEHVSLIAASIEADGTGLTPEAAIFAQAQFKSIMSNLDTEENAEVATTELYAGFEGMDLDDSAAVTTKLVSGVTDFLVNLWEMVKKLLSDIVAGAKKMLGFGGGTGGKMVAVCDKAKDLAEKITKQAESISGKTASKGTIEDEATATKLESADYGLTNVTTFVKAVADTMDELSKVTSDAEKADLDKGPAEVKNATQAGITKIINASSKDMNVLLYGGKKITVIGNTDAEGVASMSKKVETAPVKKVSGFKTWTASDLTTAADKVKDIADLKSTFVDLDKKFTALTDDADSAAEAALKDAKKADGDNKDAIDNLKKANKALSSVLKSVTRVATGLAASAAQEVTSALAVTTKAANSSVAVYKEAKAK